jgi:hypothetical protein
MYRIIKEENEAGVVEEKVCGVLTDFDLASWTGGLKKDHTPTLQQMMGTPPFMAIDLLRRLDAPRLYRHDLESLFYGMLILATNYDIEVPSEQEEGGMRVRQGLKELPYESWFGQPSHTILAAFKRTLFSSLVPLDLSPDFEDFRGWLEALHMSVQKGFRAKETYEDRFLTDESEDEAATEFDGETLGGHVNYSALIDPVRSLKGELEGLIIRYDPSLSTSTAQADSSR